MLLDRIDIDTHGPLKHVELGPLSEHLNVVLAPDDSGKTAISRFVRDALVDRDYPVGMFSSSTGRVVLADRHGMVHCHREQDGTAQGRRRITFEARGDFRGRFDDVESAWLDGVSKSSHAGATVASLDVPESIVDCVVTDTSDGCVSRVVSACVRSGLNSAASSRTLPLQEGSLYEDWNTGSRGFSAINDQQYDRNRRLRKQLADVEAELARHTIRDSDFDSLVNRKRQLTARLKQAVSVRSAPVASSREILEKQSTDLQHRARNLRTRQSELRRRLADLELDIASCDHGYHSALDAASNHRNDSSNHRNDYPLLCRDRDAILSELDRLNSSLDACLREATTVSRKLRARENTVQTARFASSPSREDFAGRDAIKVEIAQIDDQLAILSRVRWLRTRRTELLHQMRVTPVERQTENALAEGASRWLLRLSGGRLRRIDWHNPKFESDRNSYHHNAHATTSVTIDGRKETDCALVDRTLASLAVRMAAGDLMARTGRHLPLVVEIPPEAFQVTDSAHRYERVEHAYHEQGDHLRSNHPLATALRDYVQAGRQLLVLTSSRTLAEQLARVGARQFQVHAQRITHPHRPLWRPQYQSESYVGPHPHTYGERDAHDVNQMPASRPYVATSDHSVDVNRELDVAYQESQYSDRHVPVHSVEDSAPRTDWARDGVSHRDGIYFADTYTTAPSEEEQLVTGQSGLAQPSKPTPESPYYLTVDSPIDQAPSVDAVAAARLRGVKVTHITHLMQRDPNRLSDALGMASVDAPTIRRWQAECRLACRVPNLRGFDARVLVGCGVTTPGQLAAIHPTDLLHDVESFLATESGQQLLLRGTSQELSRIMTWIATANSTSERRLVGMQDSRRGSQRRRIIRTMNERDAMLHTGRPLSTDELALDTSSVRRTVRSAPKSADRTELDGSTKTRTKRRKGARRSVRRREVERSNVVAYESDTPDLSSQLESVSGDQVLRFYLDRSCPVVDAPSIGPKMSDRLETVGVESVDDLLQADPDTLANNLDHPRVDADSVQQWQQQASLVCRVPMLRGHDAQLLVASGVTTAEELAHCDATNLFSVVDVIARSSEGKRILRGGQLPNLQEVTEWIRYAGYQRELRAA